MAAGAYAAPSAAHEEKESVLQTAAGSDSSNSRYTYAHRGFYMDSYIIEMGWNLTDTMGIIENAGSREITLADRSRIVVYFGGMPFGGYTGNADGWHPALQIRLQIPWHRRSQDIRPQARADPPPHK